MRLKQNKTSISNVPKAVYYRGKSQPDSHKVTAASVKVRAKATAKTTIDILLILGLLIFVCYDLLLKPSPKLFLNSTAYHPTAVYQAAADKLSRSLKSRTKLTYNQNAMISSLKSEFPEINQANISFPLIGQHPTIKLDIAKPLFSLASANNQFIINQAGVIVTRGKISASNNLTALNDKSGIVPKDGERLLSADAISFMEQVLAQAQNAKLNVSSVTLPAQAQELDLYVKGTPYYTKFYLGGDPLIQSGQWLAARHQFSQKNITPSKYLDVRVAGKIYYK